jgi:release factor glutamine methyltransferase
MKALEKLNEVSKTLAPRGIEAAEKEAELLIRYGLNISPVDLYRDNPELNDKQILAIEEIVNRRSRREPLQYILGYTDFLGLKILVGHGVLIPRPETELMAEYAIKEITNYKLQITNRNSSLSILDLCTGSGCLALALAKEFPDAKFYGTDISRAAINYARKNGDINKIKNVSFFEGHLFEPVSSGTSEQLFDFIISNSPYIKTNDIKDLQPEIREWEPINALDGGQDGLDYYRRIIPAAQKFLKDNGILMLELGAGCANDVAGMCERTGYTQIETEKDLAGIERIITARK